MAALLLNISISHATAINTITINGAYTAYASGAPGYVPTVNNASSGYLPSPFTESLSLGATTAATTFLLVGPISGGSGVGTKTGTVAVNFTFATASKSSVSSVTYSSGGNAVTLANGVISTAANYELFYGNQTDCITWNASSCTPTDNTTTIGETIEATFTNGAVLDVNLYNWSDWTMSPKISFDLVKDPSTVPEPVSVAIFGSALAGLALTRRRAVRAKTSNDD